MTTQPETRLHRVGLAAIVLLSLLVVYLGCNKSPTAPTTADQAPQGSEPAALAQERAPASAPSAASAAIASVTSSAEEGYGEDDRCDPVFTRHGAIVGLDEIKQGKHAIYQIQGMAGNCGTCKDKKCKVDKFNYKWTIETQPEKAATVTPQGDGSMAKVIALKGPANVSLKVEVTMTCTLKKELLCAATSDPINPEPKAIGINQ